MTGVQTCALPILIYSLVLAPIGMSPWLFGYAGLVYGLIATAGGLAMVALAWQLLRASEGAAMQSLAMRLFAFSIPYLFVLFAVLMIERLAGVQKVDALLGRVFAWIF